VVAEEEVLAVLRAILPPILTGNVDGWSLGMGVKRVFNLLLLQKIEYSFLALAHTT
jgi:hypothetical protein